MTNQPHIAVFRLSAMGDVAMTVPVISAFVAAYPEAKVTIISRPFFKPFFENIPNVHFFAIDVAKKHKGLLGLFRLFTEINSMSVTHVADLHNVLRTQIVRFLLFATGVHCAGTNKGRKEKKALTKLGVKTIFPVKPMVERHLDTFEKLGFSFHLKQPLFAPKAVLPPTITSFAGEKTQKWIGIAPFAQYESKVYPLDLMQEVIDLLANTNNQLFLFGGGKDEIARLNQLKKERENVIVVAGKTTFSDELKLIQHLDIMLSMDSGNAHIAAMYGIKVISLWGATHPFAGFAPFHQPIENCLTADRTQYPLLPTSVYGNKKVTGYENAMRTIDPQSVFETIQRQIEE